MYQNVPEICNEIYLVVKKKACPFFRSTQNKLLDPRNLQQRSVFRT